MANETLTFSHALGGSRIALWNGFSRDRAPPEPGYLVKPAHREAGVEANAVARVSEAHPGLRANQPADPGAGFALTGYAL